MSAESIDYNGLMQANLTRLFANASRRRIVAIRELYAAMQCFTSRMLRQRPCRH